MTARRSNQSILKEINPEYLLEGLMLKLKLQYFVHLMPRADSPKKVHPVKAMVLPGVIYRCKSWTIKKVSADELRFSDCGAAEGS